MKKIFIIFIVTIFSTTAQASMDFLNNGFGIRAVGMGGAYTALSEGPTSIFYNPAKPQQLSNFFIDLESGNLIETDFLAVAIENPIFLSDFRFGYTSNFSGGIPYTFINNLGQPEALGPTFTYDFRALSAAWNKEIMNLNWGIWPLLFLKHWHLKQPAV